MSKKTLDELHHILCGELDEIAKKRELGAGDLEIVHKLTDTIKNINKIKMLEDEGDYSQRGGYSGNSYAGGSYNGDMRGEGAYGGNYGGGYSGARRGEHWVRGHYSRGSGAEHIAGELRDMMNRADDGEIRRALERAIRAIEE